MKKTQLLGSLISALIVFILLGCSRGKPSETSVDSTATITQVPNQENTSIQTAEETIYAKLFSALEAGKISDAESVINQNKFDIVKYESSNHIEHDHDGTLLFKFTASNNISAIRFLLSHGVDPNKPCACQGEEGCNDAYAVTCDPAASDLLIKAGSKRELDFMFTCILRTNDINEYRALVKKGANPNGAVPFAVRTSQTEFLLELVNAGADKNNILFWINGLDRKDSTFNSVIQFLILQGADPTVVLYYAIKNQFTGLTDFLLDKGADKNKAILYATDFERMSLIKKLILLGAHLQEASKVAYSDNEELKTLVLEVTNGKAYSDLVSGPEGDIDPSELIAACRDGKTRAADFMLKAGANPNVYCTDCNELPGSRDDVCLTSTLGQAMEDNNTELVTLLKKYGAKLPEGCDK